MKGERVLTDSTLIAANASLDSLQANEPALAKQEKMVQQDSKIGIKLQTRKVTNKTHTSLTDPDATLAFKAGTPGGLKYKIHLSVDADSRVILAIQATTGACHNLQPYLKQLNTIEERYQLTIKETTADRAYGSAEIIDALLNKGIHPYIPFFSTRSGSFVPKETEGIIFESEHNRYRCQKGHYLHPHNKGYKGVFTYISRSKDCKNCTLKQQCNARPKKNHSACYVIRNIHQALYEKMKKEMTTHTFINRLIERMHKAEGLIYESKHRHGLKRAKYRGLLKMQIQALMVASVQNSKRIVKFLLFIFYCENMLFSHR
ncbi:MAG: IS1182 family transposase ISCaa15 [Legionellaceae bacterium]